jgi:hypothetical protein
VPTALAMSNSNCVHEILLFGLWRSGLQRSLGSSNRSISAFYLVCTESLAEGMSNVCICLFEKALPHIYVKEHGISLFVWPLKQCLVLVTELRRFLAGRNRL